MRFFCIVICLLGMTFSAMATVDLEQTMKNMALQYKQTRDIQQSADLVPILDELIILTQQALEAKFADDKATQYTTGLHKVLTELKAAKHAAEQDDLPQAKQHLQQVDVLRKEYHKLRKVSFWQILFG
ncbi:cytochrome b562 [Rheinheimera baltica]|uniref:cytochrome b562 n=1 Tax=Rheinheimera baltica TaxID=67576 RepID=UPI00273D832E|nr:cytochrome b562 [Rheinheimera baltica]MDP5191350.1 cytochrome b562 [Rheinheimera baltica]